MHRISTHLRAPHLLDSDSELVTQYKNKYKNKDKWPTNADDPQYNS